MKDYLYIIDDKCLFLSADEEISYRQAWKLVKNEISLKNKTESRIKSTNDKYKCNYKHIKSFTDLENLITI